MTNTTKSVPPPLPMERNTLPPKDDLWDTVLTGKNLFRAGLALVLLGLVFMFRYAVEAGLIGPTVRVAMGAGASVVMLGVGSRLVSIRKGFGTLLAGGGVAGLYVTVYAAFQLYDMTSNTTAFIQLTAVSVLGVGLALRWDAEALAVASLAGALIAPILIPGRLLAGTGDALYFAVVVAAAVAMFLVRDWLVLYASAFVMGTAVIVFESVRAGLSAGEGSTVEIDLMLAALVIGFLAAPVAAWLAGTVSESRVVVGASAVGPVAFALAFSAHTSETMFLASVALGLGVLHGVTAYLVRRDQLVATVHGLVGSGLGLIAATLVLEGPVEGLEVAAIASAVLIIGFRNENELVKWTGGLTLALAGMANLQSLAELDGVGDTVARMAVVALIGLTAVVLDRDGTSEAIVARNVAAGYVYFATFVIGLVDLATYNQALVTAVWSALAVSLILVGSIGERTTMMRLGLGTMAAILVKVFLVDLATVETIWKMALFLALGVVLLVVGYWISNED